MRRSLLVGGFVLAVYALVRMFNGRRNRYGNFGGMGRILRYIDPATLRDSSRILARTGMSMFRKMAR
ncbi:hypothetical protein PP175_19990 [Aneurinibacillus sp. Ricciae_BoGa-3]|uniref:hypothetical protein n=1 Tax=Aneurinibacillus sp. Ricciae_BoGa-3 TaxID=3022697 RepID=UPI00233FD5D2|nr:hypothetical protein [Aneurinibacillus sp. Ricciae_BoGa-3]WCK53592.1 hypothetical protein PP175_19990 [Aneurinibacillus sp. Ricciae_BoGa-3]